MSAAVVSLSEVALVPDQAPEAAQELAFVEDQVSVEDPPFETDGGFAASDTVGTGGGGGRAEVPSPPPPPPQAERPRPANRAANAKSATFFDTTTPRLVVVQVLRNHARMRVLTVCR
jgi:hypothetical protein